MPVKIDTVIVGVIMGLWQKKNDALLGMRDVIQQAIAAHMEPNTVPTVRIVLMTAEWNDPASIEAIVAAHTDNALLILIGHSHGGDRAIRVCQGEYGNKESVLCLITLDAKVPPMEDFDHFIHPERNYPIPALAETIYSFAGGFGSLVDAADNSHQLLFTDPKYVGIGGHPNIPQAPVVQGVIQLAISAAFTLAA